MNDFSSKFDDGLDIVQAVILSTLTKLGPFAIAMMPASFTGYSIYSSFEPVAGPGIALFFALLTGLAIETIGIVVAHTGLEMYNAYEEANGHNRRVRLYKFAIMPPLLIIYVGVSSATIYVAGDAFSTLTRALGIASPWLVSITYIAVALARDVRRQERREQAAQERAEAGVRADREAAALGRRQTQMAKLQFGHLERMAAEVRGTSVNVHGHSRTFTDIPRTFTNVHRRLNVQRTFAKRPRTFTAWPNIRRTLSECSRTFRGRSRTQNLPQRTSRRC